MVEGYPTEWDASVPRTLHQSPVQRHQLVMQM